MLLSLEINDQQAKAFIAFLKNLEFVKINQSEPSEEEQIDLIKERQEEYLAQKDNANELKDILEKLRTQYGF
ncbi:MAG: hypothetical protein IT236_16165 [Bacteroidia bacterium]|nr:hypothetical protein [Bacteroidia bacterium]